MRQETMVEKTYPLILRSKAIVSDDGTGIVFCSKGRSSECWVVMTAINNQRSSIYRGTACDKNDGKRSRLYLKLVDLR